MTQKPRVQQGFRAFSIRTARKTFEIKARLSKTFSKKILEILLEIDMPYGVRNFWVRTKKEPKTLVNTGFFGKIEVFISSFICYNHLCFEMKM